MNTQVKHISESAKHIINFENSSSHLFSKKLKADADAEDEISVFVFDDYLSPNKQQQLNASISRAANPKDGWSKHQTVAYTYAEFTFECWARKNGLSVFDYNDVNPFSPSDYKIENKDIDVKSVIGIGKRLGTQYSDNSHGSEVLIGVCTHAENLNDEMLTLSIDGVFDPVAHQGIDSPLKYLKLNSSPNVCYFSSLYDYFLEPLHMSENFFPDDKSLLYYAVSKNAVPHLIRNTSTKKLDVLLKTIITERNYGLIPIIKELHAKKKLMLFHHYLADYLIKKTFEKTEVDGNNISDLVDMIEPCSFRKKKFIQNLLKANESLHKVRCHWHPDETIKEMGIDIYYSDTSNVPTLKAICSCNRKGNVI
ncbi:hypothetical protein [Endozoicomonas atrinae]|uniref:hypothetical protein n=1 Tax=Endozoicomonas atrinae TaxID=1333660 RepID=UPI0008245D07|nr:hypothetical protein [Endozoicomonas atrinae]